MRHTSLYLSDFRSTRTFFAILVVGVLHFFVSQFGNQFLTLPESPITLIWYPPGVGLAAVLILGPRVLPAIVIASFLSSGPFYEYADPDNLLPTYLIGATFGLGDGLLVGWSYCLFLRLPAADMFASMRTIIRFFAVVALVPVMVSSAILVAGLIIFDPWLLHMEQPALAIAETWGSFVLSDMHGMITLVPLVAAFFEAGVKGWNWRRLSEQMAILLCVGGVVYASLFHYGHIVYLVTPLFLWTATRVGMRGMTITLFLFSLTMALSTVQGLGPFAVFDQTVAFGTLTLMTFCFSFTFLCFASVWKEHQRDRDVLEQRVIDRTAEVEAARARMIDAIESTSEGFSLYDADNRLILSNNAFKEMWGYSDADIERGPTARELLALDLERGTIGDKNGTSDTMRGRPTEFARGVSNLDLQLADGRWVQIRDRRTSEGGTVSFHTDITDRKRTEEELLQKERQLRIVLDNVPAGVRYVDQDRRYILFNAKYSELWDFPEDLIQVGESVRTENLYLAERGDFGSGNPEEIEKSVTYALPFETEPTHYERTTIDGRVLEVFTQPIETGGFVSIYSDITERKRGEQALKDAKDIAEAAAEAKTEFVAMVSHEVRTPMNGVMGMARVLADMQLDREQRDHAETIVRSGESLLRILDDLLDMSKLTAGRLEIEKIAMDPRRFFDDAVAMMGTRAIEKGLRFEHHIANDLPPAIIGDPHRLRQILLNLIGNAIKFTQQGSVTVSMQCKQRDDAPPALVISVVDTGPGIDPAVQANLFSIYAQGSADVARKYGGTGLGLAICQRLTTLMEGHLGLESTLGAGSCFTFEIPFETASVEDIPDCDSEVDSDWRDSHAVGPLDVLLVEDSEINQKVCFAMLERQGHRVTLAVHGKEALDHLAANRFDIILMDRHMPVMDGIEATKRIRAMDTEVSETPIIGVTAAARDTDIDDCIAAGMDDVVIKPIDPLHLNRTIGSILAPDFPMGEPADPGETAAKVPGTDPAIAHPILDEAVLRKLENEYGTDLVLELIGDFHRTAHEALDRIETAAHDPDRVVLQRLSHSLKSNAGTLGLMALSARCQEIEDACIDGDLQSAIDHASRLPAVAEQALTALKRE